jgi:pimeloyl-ACP methyl ester carboxylesterase
MVLIAPAGVLKMPQETGGIHGLKDLLPDELKAEYDTYLERYLDYGRIFEKTEDELATLNHEFIKFFSSAQSQKGKQRILESEVSVKDTGGWMVHAMYLSLGLKYDLREHLKTIPSPVLVLHGQKDVFSSDTSQEYASLIPGAIFTEIEDASHFPFEEKPDVFSSLLANFLENPVIGKIM